MVYVIIYPIKVATTLSFFISRLVGYVRQTGPLMYKKMKKLCCHSYISNFFQIRASSYCVRKHQDWKWFIMSTFSKLQPCHQIQTPTKSNSFLILQSLSFKVSRHHIFFKTALISPIRLRCLFNILWPISSPTTCQQFIPVQVQRFLCPFLTGLLWFLLRKSHLMHNPIDCFNKKNFFENRWWLIISKEKSRAKEKQSFLVQRKQYQ